MLLKSPKLIASFLGLVLLPLCAGASERVVYSQEDLALIKSHGPWPPATFVDPSNRVSANPAAIQLGQELFFSADLSIDKTMACATCHDPEENFIDGLNVGHGRAALPRNTPSLVNLQGARWFGWDGGADSLWAQSIRPLIAPNEMASNGKHIQKTISNDPVLSCLYTKTFKAGIDRHGPEESLVNAAKALAAFQETLVTAPTPFDRFRDALITAGEKGTSDYPLPAQRGLKIFVGKGRCSLCHFGPKFTNEEFGDIGIPFFLGKGQVDKGRYDGVKKVKKSPYALTGAYSDDTSKHSAIKTKQVTLLHKNWGEFKVPSLRNVARTAPYMHNGTLPTLDDVVRHYSEIDEERLHVDGERILSPLRLKPQESRDLVAFLETLSAPLKTPIQVNAPLTQACQTD